MKTRYLAGVFFWLVGLMGGVAGSGAQALARPARAAAPVSLEGVWRGALPVPGGEWELSFSIVALTGGRYFAALDVPMQKLSRVPVVVVQPAGTDSVLLLVPQIESRFLARRLAGSQQLAGVWCRPGLRTPVTLQQVPLPTATGPSARFAPPYHEEEVFFSNFNAKLKLAGTLTVPPGPGPFPAIVLVSDLDEQDRDGLAPAAALQAGLMSYRLLGSLADYLTRHGLAVLRYDDRGVGKSGGANAVATPTQRAGDVQAALNYLRTRPEVDLLHLGLIGHGEGASIAFLVAAQPLPPAFVVGLGAYGLPGYQTLLQQQEQAWRAQKIAPEQLELRVRRQRTLYDLIRYSTNQPQTLTIVANLLRQGEPTMPAATAAQQAATLLTPSNRAFLAFDPLESLPAVQCPVLLITGQADDQAPATEHLAAVEHELKSNGNHNVTAFRPVGVNHLFQPPQFQWTMLDGEMKPVFAPVVQELIRQWLGGLK